MPIISSSPTTLTVAQGSALLGAAAAMGPNSFVVFQQPSLSARGAHPASGRVADVTEDGAGFVGHTAIDWAGKGCYDPVTRRVMWASCGAGNNQGGGKVFNVHPIYSEATNAWSATRNFQADGETTTNGIGHMYDSNCIHVTGRRFYKKKFDSGDRKILVFNLDTNAWSTCISSPPDEAYGSGDGAMEVVPTRGPAGAIWLVSLANQSNLPKLWEYSIASQSWSTLIDTGSFGAPRTNTPVMSFNPRAFGGAGGVLVGTGAGAWTVRADTLSIASVGSPPSTLSMPSDGHLCRDPVGSGWLYASDSGSLYRCDGTTWTQRARLPDQLGASGNGQPLVVVPIDAYGVVWIIAAQGSANRAWLYKP